MTVDRIDDEVVNAGNILTSLLPSGDVVGRSQLCYQLIIEIWPVLRDPMDPREKDSVTLVLVELAVVRGDRDVAPCRRQQHLVGSACGLRRNIRQDTDDFVLVAD